MELKSQISQTQKIAWSTDVSHFIQKNIFIKTWYFTSQFYELNASNLCNPSHNYVHFNGAFLQKD
jgi:hypothetical protein